MAIETQPEMARVPAAGRRRTRRGRGRGGGARPCIPRLVGAVIGYMLGHLLGNYLTGDGTLQYQQLPLSDSSDWPIVAGLRAGHHGLAGRPGRVQRHRCAR